MPHSLRLEMIIIALTCAACSPINVSLQGQVVAPSAGLPGAASSPSSTPATTPTALSAGTVASPPSSSASPTSGPSHGSPDLAGAPQGSPSPVEPMPSPTPTASPTPKVFNKPAMTTETLRDVEFVNAFEGFICGTNGALFKTTDGGDKWTPIHSDVLGTQQLRALSFISPEEGWLLGDDGIYKTENSGDTWAKVSDSPGWLPNYTGSEMLLLFRDRDNGFVVTGEQGLLVTSDGGKTWKPQDTAFKPQSLARAGKNTVAFGYGAASVLVPGEGWSEFGPLGTGMGSGLVSFVDEQNGWQLVSHMLQRTTDGGRSFVDVVQFPTVSSSMGFADKDHGLIATEYGSLAIVDASQGKPVITRLNIPENNDWKMSIVSPDVAWLVGGSDVIEYVAK